MVGGSWGGNGGVRFNSGRACVIGHAVTCCPVLFIIITFVPMIRSWPESTLFLNITRLIGTSLSLLKLTMIYACGDAVVFTIVLLSLFINGSAESPADGSASAFTGLIKLPPASYASRRVMLMDSVFLSSRCRITYLPVTTFGGAL